MVLRLDFLDSECTLLVDSGAEISIFKTNRINPATFVDTNDQCSVSGINDYAVPTLGTALTYISLQNQNKIGHKFHLVDHPLPIPTDGILGRDFLCKYHCTIDYDTWILTGRNKSENFEFPIHDSIEGNIFLPPRCEAFRQVNIGSTTSTYLVKSDEIKPGVFVANSLVNSQNSILKFLNTTDKMVAISRDFQNHLTDIENYDVYTFNKQNENVEKRHQQLISELQLDQTPRELNSKVIELCKGYDDIFALKTDNLTSNNFYKQGIELIDNSPVYIKNYRLPEVHREEIKIQVDKMLKEDIIQPSLSPYNSPILVVPKKSATNDKKWRLVVDFRQLNKKILGDKFPLPRIDDILDQLGRAKYFSTLDLMSGFHQIEIDDNSKKYTAFSTDSGHYEFKRLPFGLNISPNSFQRMMTIALSGLPADCAFLYIDDIIVIGCSVTHHLQNLKLVFDKLRQRNLKLNPAKCNFFCSDVTYLGHHISNEGIQPDKSKFSAIKDFPVPQNADDVRRFVAFCNYYRRFIPYFAEIAHPLNNLLRKNVKFEWTEDCGNSFEILKHKLISPQILKFPDFRKPFILSTDASQIACGAVLTQQYDDIYLPVAFASRSFTKGERNKSTIEQELIAIHWAITYFRPYLYGRRFTVKTDHRPLVYLFTMKNPSSRLTRIRVDLEEFDFSIEHVEGKLNIGADALSRVIVDSDELKSISVLPIQTRSMTRSKANNDTEIRNSETDHLRAYDSVNNIDAFNLPKLVLKINETTPTLTMDIYDKKMKKNLAQAQLSENKCKEIKDVKEIIDIINVMATHLNIKRLAIARNSVIFSKINSENFKALYNKSLNEVDLVVYTPAQIISNKTDIDKIILEGHTSPLGGHVGTTRLLNKLRTTYYWKNMRKTINQFVKNCIDCKRNKHTIHTKEKFIETTTPSKAFNLVSIDTIGPMTKTINGNRYALTLQCDLTKYVIAVPIPDKQAQTLAKAFVDHFILIFGCPILIKTDLGTEYKNELFQNICLLLSINHNFSTAYHPQTIGGLERNHRCLNEYLRQFISEQQDDWDSWLKYYTFCYNTTPNTEHNYTPYELVFGNLANYPQRLANPEKIDPIYNYDSYYTELNYRLQHAASKAKELLIKAKQKRITKQSATANPTDISIGEKILLKSENNRKLDMVYNGPHEVISINHPNITIKNCNTNEQKTVHKNRIIKL